jgi:hypothetical protein
MNLSHGEGLVDPPGPLGAEPIVDNGAGADAAAVGGSEGGAFVVAGDYGRPADVAVGADERKAVGKAQVPIGSGPIVDDGNDVNRTKEDVNAVDVTKDDDGAVVPPAVDDVGNHGGKSLGNP